MKLLYFAPVGERTIDECLMLVEDDFNFEEVERQAEDAIGDRCELVGTLLLTQAQAEQLEDMADHRPFIG